MFCDGDQQAIASGCCNRLNAKRNAVCVKTHWTLHLNIIHS
jgi:hypothetical protein